MWFSTREAIRMKQVRGLTQEIAYEGQLRMFSVISGNRVDVEPKEDMKERMGFSPDEFDWLAVCVEGARQRGFKIETIGRDIGGRDAEETDFLANEAREYRSDLKRHLLVHN
jgi:hypothetical protein